MKPSESAIREKILLLAQARGVEKTFCPSEVARSLDALEWRKWMDTIRNVGTKMMREGVIEITQHGITIDPQNIKGPVRFRLKK